MHVEGVGVAVNVDRCVGAKIDRIRTGDEDAVVVIGIEHLHRQRFPAAGGTAVDEARPALTDAAKLFLDRGDQFGLDGIAVRPEVGRVHRVRVVVVGIRVIDFRDEDAREFRRDPLLIELVGLFLLNAVVAGDVEAFAVVRLQIGIGRLGAKAAEVGIEVVFVDDDRKMNVGMRIESLGHQHVGAQEHGPSPELGEQRALNLEVPDVLRVLRRRDRRDFLVEHNRNRLGRRSQRDFLRSGIEIARRKVPVLAFAAIHGQLHGVAVGAVESLVAMQHGLHVILSRRHVAQTADGIAVGGIIHHYGLARLHAVNVHAEHHLGADGVVDLHARLGGRVSSKEEGRCVRRALSRCGFLGKETEKLGPAACERGAETRMPAINTKKITLRLGKNIESPWFRGPKNPADCSN